MEDHRHQRDIFSFPITPPHQDSDFEFGCLTPDSPTADPYNNSPADHLFYNGKMLPHSFIPPQQQPPPPPSSISGSTSRSSRKDSLMSSRSNSVNSSSSGRTSSSGENWERKMLYRCKKYGSVNSNSSPMASKLVMAQLYGSSQRWQHIVPLPALKREDSKKLRKDCEGGSLNKEKDEKCKKEEVKKSASGYCLRFLKSLLVACRECHGMEPSTADDILH